MSSFGTFEEFWAASSVFFDRLKRGAQIAVKREESTDHELLMTRLREAQKQTNRQMQQTDAHLDHLHSLITTLAGTITKRAQGHRAS